MIDRVDEKRDRERERVRKSIEAKMGFFIHLMVYVVVNITVFFPENVLDGFNFISLPSIGWGIGVAAHFVKTFVFNSEYIERKVDELVK